VAYIALHLLLAVQAPPSWQSVICRQGYATHQLQAPALGPEQRLVTVQCVEAKWPPSAAQTLWISTDWGLWEVASNVEHVNGDGAVLSNVQQPTRLPGASEQPATLSQLPNDNVPPTLSQNAPAAESLVDSPKALTHRSRPVI